MSYERVSSGKLSSALFAVVRFLASVQLDVALQVVKSSELGVARLAGERLLVGVCEKMRLEVVVSGECVVAQRAYKFAFFLLTKIGRVYLDVVGVIVGITVRGRVVGLCLRVCGSRARVF